LKSRFHQEPAFLFISIEGLQPYGCSGLLRIRSCRPRASEQIPPEYFEADSEWDPLFCAYR